MNSIVLYGPSDWSNPRLQLPPRTLAVVIDVLRATSTIVTAFSNGVKAIHPVSDLATAKSLKDKLPSLRLAGEKGGRRIEGFDFGNSPREFVNLPHDLGEIRLAMLTTNGTRAFGATRDAEEVVVASMLNRNAVSQKIRSWKGTTVYICAGTGDDFSLEDAIVAGAFLEETDSNHPLASLYRFTRKNLREVFRSSKNGANLIRIGMEADIDFVLEVDRFSILPYYDPRTGVIGKT